MQSKFLKTMGEGVWLLYYVLPHNMYTRVLNQECQKEIFLEDDLFKIEKILFFTDILICW